MSKKVEKLECKQAHKASIASEQHENILTAIPNCSNPNDIILKYCPHSASLKTDADPNEDGETNINPNEDGETNINPNEETEVNSTSEQFIFPTLKLIDSINIESHCISYGELSSFESRPTCMFTIDTWKEGHKSIVIWDTSSHARITPVQTLKFPNKLVDAHFFAQETHGESLWIAFSNTLHIYTLETNKKPVPYLPLTTTTRTSLSNEQILETLSQNLELVEDSTQLKYELKYELKLPGKTNCFAVNRDCYIMTGSSSGDIVRAQFSSNFEDIDNSKNPSLSILQYVSPVTTTTTRFSHHSRKVNALFDYKCKYLLSISEDKSVARLEYSSNQVTIRQQEACVRTAKLEISSGLFYTGNTSGDIIVYDINTNDFVEVIRYKAENYIDPLLPFTVNEKQHYIWFAMHARKWCLLDVKSKTIIQESEKYNDYISLLLPYTDNQLLLGEGKNLLQVWKISTTQPSIL